MSQSHGQLSEFVGDIDLQSGARFSGARLVYKTYGTLNAQRSNAILFPTRFGGTHEQNEFLIQPGMALDPEQFFVIVPNMLGNGVSSSPSNAEGRLTGAAFPAVTIYDNVCFQHRLVRDTFGIEKFAAVVGWSMGAQQAFQWAALYPEMVPKLACLCGTAKTTDHNRVFLEGVRAAIEADSTFQAGHYGSTPPLAGLRAAGRIYAGWAYSQAWYREQTYQALGFTSLDDFLVRYWDALFQQRDANNIMAMTATWIANDISVNPKFNGNFAMAMAAIDAQTLLMPCATDLYFCTADSEREHALLKRATLVEIPSIWGHMAGAGQNAADTEFIDQHLAHLLSD